MKKYTFLIQKELDGLPSYDFGYDIISNIKGLNSFLSKNNIDYRLINVNNLDKLFDTETNKHIPIGSVQFVEYYMFLNNIIIPSPLNIPKHLRKVRYCRRIIDDISFDEFTNNINKYKNYYIKPADKYKQFEVTKGYMFNDFVKSKTINNLFISSEITQKIKNEFRCFVFDNKIESIKPYVNDISYKISNKYIELLKEIIDLNIKNNLGLSYYAIDFATLEDNSFELIELHHPYSLGTYGYKNESLLYFFLRGFLNMVNNKGA